MPKSKRDKKVSLTQTKKKGTDHKKKLIAEVRECVDKYTRIFAFSVQNMRNSKLKDVRQKWSHSRFFFGKNKVMAIALGRRSDAEHRINLHKLSRKLQGQTGLLFTNSSKDEVVKWFNEFSEADYARSGNIATQTVTLEPGPMTSFSHSMEPQLRKLGLPTSLEKGIVTLMKEHKICLKGDRLTPEQARLLKYFGHKMSSFRITLECMWSSNGKFKVLENTRPDPVIPSSIRIQPKQKDTEADTEMQAEESDEEDEEMSDIEPEDSD